MAKTIDNDLKQQFNRVLLNTFKETIDFLDAHGSRWWGAYGTILGAVRHKGLIPWDDDIDIYMPREDYNKLLSLRPEMAKTNIDVISYEDVGYIYGFAKIVNRNTTLWELEEYPFAYGVYIDIFPLEQTDETNTEIASNHALYSRKLHRMYLAYQNLTPHNVASGLYHYGISYINNLIFAKFHKRRVIDEFKAFDRGLNRECGSKYVRYAYSTYRILEKSWFDTYVEMPFEWFTIKVPVGYKTLLELSYGDYMTPPPIEKRVSEHKRIYLNLKEKLTLQEVKQRLKRGENLVY